IRFVNYEMGTPNSPVGRSIPLRSAGGAVRYPQRADPRTDPATKNQAPGPGGTVPPPPILATTTTIPSAKTSAIAHRPAIRIQPASRPRLLDDRPSAHNAAAATTWRTGAAMTKTASVPASS